MKKLILLLLAFAGFAVTIPQAEAGHRDRYVRYYDDCHRPVYGYTYRRSYYRPSYYCAPRPRYYNSGYCAPRYYHSRPRFSFSFGF